jgi:hypothetical protein
MKIPTAILLFALAAQAGTRPRAAAADYQSSETGADAAVGAEIVPEDQLKNLFSTDLRRGYVVVEVALYPANGKSVDLSAMDFLLRVGADRTIRAANPRAIPRAVEDRNAPRPSDVNVYTTAGVAVENGPYGRRVYTSAGVGVDNGPPIAPPPASHPQDRQITQWELEQSGLPEGVAAQAVSGYLYFPYTANKRKKVALELEYHGAAGTIRVALK